MSYIPLEPSRLEPARAGAEIPKHRGLYVCITYVLRTNIPHFQHRTYQNTTRIAEIVTRFMIAMVTEAALVVPLIVLSRQNSRKSRLLVVISFVSIFCFLLSLLSKASNYEIMAASAAYAAVLTVFVSNS